MLVREVMTTHLHSVRSGDTVTAAARLMKESNIGFLPIIDDGLLVGLLTDRDIVTRAVADGMNPNEIKVSQIKTPKAWTISADSTIEEAAGMMEEKKVRRLLVVNRQQKLVGVVTLGDLAVLGNNREETEHALECISSPAKGGRIDKEGENEIAGDH